MNDTPVLLIIFRRSGPTRQVLEVLRKIKPPVLLVAADGPRPDRKWDKKECEETRALIDELVDWKCVIHRDYSEENLGSAVRPHTAIEWAFEHVERLVILEDDCIPNESFFGYCKELLDRYEHDERVMHISGTAYSAQEKEIPESYFFSHFPACWGWATWKRAWKLYSFRTEGWESLRDTDWISRIIPDPFVRSRWAKEFDKAISNDGSYTAWDFQWGYSCWANSGLSIFPRVNLITNVGFGDDATHMHGDDDPMGHLPTSAIESPLVHPKRVCVHPVEEKNYVLKTLRPRALPDPIPSLSRRICRKLKRILSVNDPLPAISRPKPDQ
jgi:hypothetical protein